MKRIAIVILFLAGPAWADPPPAAIAPPAEQTIVMKRRTVEVLVAEAAAAEQTREELKRCRTDLLTVAKADEPSPGWWTAVKWTGLGGALVGAFVLGLLSAR